MRNPAIRLSWFVVAVLALGAVTSAALAESRSAQGPATAPDAALLFAYRINPGQGELFQAGYRRHLDWHREHSDPLVWYGWTVLIGDQPGLFVDGVFGVPYSAVDERVDPAGDAADMAQNASPFVQPAYRCVLRLRRELSTATPLEKHSPTPLQTLVWVRVKPGTKTRFETLLQKLHAAAGRQETPLGYSWYEVVTGGPDPGYLLLIPARVFADLGASPTTLSGLVRAVLPAGELGAVQQELAATVVEVTVETWRYLPRLSYFPEE